ncbi:glyoxalase/bleomycin resistance protein/dioxygenase [Halalkalibacter wakoensis JCM 9140]|uniref:Glyoxalase/bleomycin resistance protein/dioxygenase n=1 Tax=Halalkalibacter wakoensis JCM 9140 TaxID=1236970 RepID=W4Q1Y4_9BACI|nr:VOC family protein [Halalkalibacter wakoensis]GAE25940.1 glyoxalase/bleomycin resistance protein/dioxygenase [Halalkalibacter wakoensis JCM 9140]
MINIFKLGYVEFNAKNLEEMKNYYSEIVGFTESDQDENGSVYFTSSTDHHNIVLSPSNQTGIKKVGFQYESDLSINEVADYLKRFDIKTTIQFDAKPGVPELIQFEDPEGYQIELYQSMSMTKKPGYKSKGIVPNKIGHLSLRVKDAKKQVAFYEKIGFVNTDWIEDYFGFMTCNRDHHVLNFFTSEKKGMHHIAFEMRNYAHLVDTLDFLRLNGKHLEWGPSRHGAGHNIACYHYDPEGNLIELFTDADVFIKELGIFDPRPWHQDFPQKPKVWSTDECLSLWGVDFEKALV